MLGEPGRLFTKCLATRKSFERFRFMWARPQSCTSLVTDGKCGRDTRPWRGRPDSDDRKETRVRRAMLPVTSLTARRASGYENDVSAVRAATDPERLAHSWLVHIERLVPGR